MQDCLIACVDGLQGLPEAIETVFPKTQVQLCIVHKVRNSLKYVPWKERRAVAADLRAIYGATTLAAAEQALERFADRWDTKYPAISPSWLADWDRLTVFFDYPSTIRRAVYTTNAMVVSLSPADNSVGPVWSRLRHINRTLLPSHLGCPRPRPGR